ncbi:MAG: hypothetical protein CMM93_02975 [Rickettsiales bacterium]|nr:hypothetical protein [Rickettsiales bacterium]
MKSLSAAFIAFFLSISAVHAGAWTQSQDSTFLAVSEFYFTSDSYYDLNGNEIGQPRFTKHEINAYVEHGYTDELTVGANLFLNYVDQDQVSPTGARIASDNYGLGDSEIFARYQVYRDNTYAVAIQPLVKLPAIYAEDRLPRGGGEQLDYELSLLGGMNFALFGRNHYLDTRIGYRYRHDDSLNGQYLADARVGLNIADQWTLIPAAYFTYSADLPSVAQFSQSGQNDYDLIKLEAMVQYALPDQPLRLHAGLFNHVDGRNSGTGTGLYLGGSYTF